MVNTRKDGDAADLELEPTVKQRRSRRAAGAATATSAAVVAKAAISDASKGVAIAHNTKAATAAKPLPTRQNNVPTQKKSKKGESSNKSTIDAVSAVPATAVSNLGEPPPAAVVATPIICDASTTVLKSPPHSQASKKSTSTISPKKIRYCVWQHCYCPHLRVTSVKCDTDGCNNTMHPQCVRQFESDINYDSDDIEENNKTKMFCPLHHPMKHRLNDDDSSDSDSDMESVSDNRKQAARKCTPKPRVLESTFQSDPMTVPPLPTLPVAIECDWRLCRPTGCVARELVPLSCQREGCNRLVHHLCQIKWHDSIMYEPPTTARFCRFHDTKYPKHFQLPLTPTHNLDSELLEINVGDDDSSDNLSQGHAGVGNTEDNHDVENTPDDNNSNDSDSNDDDNDDCDSADDGIEADVLNDGLDVEDREEEVIDDTNGVDFVVGLPGAPQGWFPPGPPDSWKGYVPQYDAPAEEDVDNPGNWHLYPFAARYNSKKKYEGHFTPCGARVVPANDDGVRQVGNWKFYYQGWTADSFDKETYVRGEAVRGNLKPPSRRGCLDADVLRKHGLTENRMIQKDALFFYQLLFPICDPKCSGVQGDNRMPYFTYASICTNMYAIAVGAGIGIGRHWRSVSVEELVHWTACPIRNGALDGNPGTLMARWNKGDRRYDDLIEDCMTLFRWQQIKRFFKLNHNFLSGKKGDNNFDPCYKYDLIYKVLIHNMNYLTKHADMDGTIDESTWGYGGYSGDCGWRLQNKPVSRGGQIAMLFDINRRYPRAYVHRHKLHKRTPPFTGTGQSEVVMLVNTVDKLIIPLTDDDSMITTMPTATLPNPNGGVYSYPIKPVYTRPPHFTADNFFSSEPLMDWLGAKGYGMTATCARNRIPGNIKPYTHHEQFDSTHLRCKVMRFQNPIVAIQQCKADGDKKAYTKTFVSFQSTGGTNIIGVNNLSSVKLYVGQKERGRKKAGMKRVYGIEQNEARETYLNHYYGCDNADHMIKNAGNRYITWKYWHSPYLHAQSLGIIAAYDMYIECCEGGLDGAWKVDVKKRMTFAQFRMRLSEQMLKYDPFDEAYTGDTTVTTDKSNKKRSRRSSESDDDDKKTSKRTKQGGVTIESFRGAVESGRLCATAEELREHFFSVMQDKGNNRQPCEVCGEPTIWRCTLCEKPMCTKSKKAWNGAKCIFQYHSHAFFGLSRSDHSALHKKELRTWVPPSDYAVMRNRRQMDKWKNDVQREAEEDGVN